MCVKAVIAFMVTIVVLFLVKAQNIQMPQQQRNNDFERPPERITVIELEVNTEVRPNPMSTNFEIRESIVNRVEHEDKVIFLNNAERKPNTDHRQELNERDRMGNNMPERMPYRNDQNRGFPPMQGFTANIERRPDHHDIPNRDNDREFDNNSKRVIEFNREQEREPYRNDQDRGTLNGQEFIVKPEMGPDRTSGFQQANESERMMEFNGEQEIKPNRDQMRPSPPRREFDNNIAHVPDRLKEVGRERERDQGNGATNRQEPRGKPARKPDRNSGFNRATEQNVKRNDELRQEVAEERKPQSVISLTQVAKSGRLCETKYNEYIARIFRNDEEVTADANDSEFDGRVLASPGEYPHMTALGFKREDNTHDYKCGGSLISENFVITAAHCTNVTGEVPTIARIGDINLKVDEKHLEPQIFRIRRIYAHPQYDGVTYYNDIALLQLNTSVEFTEFVRPIKLWSRPKLPLMTAFAMGYGATSFARAPTQQLTDFNMTLIPNDECNQSLPQLDEVPRGIIASQICAEDFIMHRDTCQGDSGGPLQYNIRGKRRRNRVHYHLIGITSFGLLCRSPNPGVYTRIYSYLDWIERTVWNSS